MFRSRSAALWPLAAALLILVFAGAVAVTAQTVEPSATTAEGTAEPNAATPEVTAEPNVGRQQFTINLGDFQTAAEITYPPEGTGPFPTVILVHGSGPEDMDATITSPWDNNRVESRIFRDIANNLALHGYAVVRYNKHYVTGPNAVDAQNFARLDMKQMAADLEKVVAAVQPLVMVNSKLLYLYGWSEGSTVAASLAAQSAGKFAGLILQGPVTQSWRDLIDAQFSDYGISYLKSLAADGKITADVLKQAIADSGGIVAKTVLNFVVDPAYFQTGAVAINAAADTNKDGAISVDDELPAAIKQWLDTAFAPGGYLSLYAPDKALPSVADQAAKLTLPTLVLQGELDANVKFSGAIELAGKMAAAGNNNFQVILYPTLGHSLGEIPSAMQDNFPPIAPQPLADMVIWLDKQTGHTQPGTPTPTP